jgi:antirestriction protein ArdC
MTATVTRKPKTSNKKGSKGEEKLVQEIIDLISKGINPWEKPWDGGNGQHRNIETGKHYQGSNQFVLEMYQVSRGYQLPLWLGFQQGKKLGLNVIKGSFCSYILRPQKVSYPELDENGKAVLDKDGKPNFIQYLKFETAAVFNIACFEGKDPEAQTKLDNLILKEQHNAKQEEKTLSERLSNAKDVLISNWCKKDNVPLHLKGDRAFYSESSHSITLPKLQFFKDEESFMSTLAHECVHSTGHKKLLNRKELYTYHSSIKERAKEELCAELGAYLVCNRLQISSDKQNHASYLDSWLKTLQEGPGVLFKIFSQATKAANLICGPEVIPAEETK